VLASGGAIFAFVLRGRFPRARWKPSRIGKYSTFAQVFTIFFALTLEMTHALWLQPYVAALVVTCAALTIVSGTQYLAYGIKAAVSGTVPPGGTA